VGALGLAGLAAAVASGEHKRSEQMRFQRPAKQLTENQERRQVHGIERALPKWKGSHYDKGGISEDNVRGLAQARERKRNEVRPDRAERVRAKAHPNSAVGRGLVSPGQAGSAPVDTSSWYVHGHETPEERKQRERRHLERMA